MRKYIMTGILGMMAGIALAGTQIISKNQDGTFSKKETLTQIEFDMETDSLRTELGYIQSRLKDLARIQSNLWDQQAALILEIENRESISKHMTPEVPTEEEVKP